MTRSIRRLRRYRAYCTEKGIAPDPNILAFATSYEEKRVDLKEVKEIKEAKEVIGSE